MVKQLAKNQIPFLLPKHESNKPNRSVFLLLFLLICNRNKGKQNCYLKKKQEEERKEGRKAMNVI